MNIEGRAIGPGEPPYVIAEIGVNHDGDPAKAIALTEQARRAGADAVKLQFFKAELLCSKATRLAAYQIKHGATDSLSLLRGLELTNEDMAAVVKHARDLNIHPLVTVFSGELVEEVKDMDWAGWKTASPDIINKPLIDALMHTGKPIILSTGAATSHEVDRAAQWLKEYPHAFLHCVSAYPTPDKEAGLFGRVSLESITPHALGYSDHTQSIDTGALAIASGSCILEKHLTHDRNAPGPDHACSLDPEGFAEYIRLVHRAHAMCGCPEKMVQKIEEDVRSVSRQSLTTTRDLEAGHVLESNDLTIKRPGVGIEPWLLNETMGRRLVRAVAGDMPLQEDDLTP